jgi:CheY-like chemotaxis protein
VEDDQFLVDIYSTKLKEVGFSVETSGDGEECLRKLKEKKFDLLILDIVLPKLDGREVLKIIKGDEKLKKIPVVLLSNLSQKEEVEKSIEAGAVKYLIKAHFTPSEVAEEIKKVLNE